MDTFPTGIQIRPGPTTRPPLAADSTTDRGHRPVAGRRASPQPTAAGDRTTTTHRRVTTGGFP